MLSPCHGANRTESSLQSSSQRRISCQSFQVGTLVVTLGNPDGSWFGEEKQTFVNLPETGKMADSSEWTCQIGLPDPETERRQAENQIFAT